MSILELVKKPTYIIPLFIELELELGTISYRSLIGLIIRRPKRRMTK